jgi:hypothetical protein
MRRTERPVHPLANRSNREVDEVSRARTNRTAYESARAQSGMLDVGWP